MKKLISLLVLFAILISCCACTGEPAETTDNTESSAASTEATEATTPGLSAELTPEQLYGMINQLEPVDGVYKIWSEVGVQNMANHPDATFELLCNVDMGGATVAPIGTADKPFTGEIKGANFSISNFTLQGGDETDFGFVGVNKGNIHNFLIENVTFVPGANAKNIGTLAGTNEGTINRCTVSGTMTVEAAAEGAACGSAVGTNTGSLANTEVTVDLNVTAAAAANVGGIVGTTTGGTIEFINTNGKLDATGTNKTVGLFAGEATDIVITSCAFVGASNTVDGVLFTNFTGNADDDERAVAAKALWRDNAAIEPLPENVQKVRDKVVQTMYELGTVEWTVKKDLTHSCTCQLSACHGVYNTTYTYYGVPYNHKNSSLARFQYCQNEDGSLVDWFYDLASYDGFDIYIGSDCSSSVQQAWWTVSNTTDIWNTRYIPEIYGRGTIAVGDYVCDFELSGTTKWTDQYINATEEQVMYESYAATRPGDAIVSQVEAGGHTRMIAEDPVIVRDQDGLINPDYSYVITHEQGASWQDEVNKIYSSWKVNYKYTFANLYFDWYVPVTCEELLTGEVEPVECELVGGCEGFSGMFTGEVKANYHMDSVTLTIQNSKGETVLDHPMWTTVQKSSDFGGNYVTARCYTDRFDMAEFAIALNNVTFEPGETYSYTVTANLATFDQIVLNESSFVYGTAA